MHQHRRTGKRGQLSQMREASFFLCTDRMAPRANVSFVTLGPAAGEGIRQRESMARTAKAATGYQQEAGQYDSKGSNMASVRCRWWTLLANRKTAIRTRMGVSSARARGGWTSANGILSETPRQRDGGAREKDNFIKWVVAMQGGTTGGEGGMDSAAAPPAPKRRS